MELCFITSNENKAKEVSLFLGRELPHMSPDVPEIQTVDVEAAVRDKAKRSYELLGSRIPVLVEDTGIYIKQLNDFPGALIKWLLGAIGNEGICDLVNGKDNRVYAQTCFCIYDGKEFKVFSGRTDGTIPDQPRGSGGFGWDNIFQPDGFNVTFAEMTTEGKNKVSMRGKALVKLKEYLKSY